MEEDFLEQVREFKKEANELVLLINEKEKENLLLDVNKFNKDEYIKELENFKKSFKKYKTNEDKRNLLKHLIKHIYIDSLNKKIRLELMI